jgi:hypothetical protein
MGDFVERAFNKEFDLKWWRKQKRTKHKEKKEIEKAQHPTLQPSAPSAHPA